jgi:hypothetical protein
MAVARKLVRLKMGTKTDSDVFEAALQSAFGLIEIATKYEGDRPELGFEAESYPEMTLFRLERWATIQFMGALRLLENDQVAYVAEVVLRGLLENLAHVWWIQHGMQDGADSKRCRAVRMELGMAVELVQSIQHADPASVPDGSAAIAQEREAHFNQVHQSINCAGKARKYGAVSGTLIEIDGAIGTTWLHELWSVGSMVSHQGMLDRIMRDMGKGITLVGEPATLIDRSTLLERVTSVYGLIARELLTTNSPPDVEALGHAMAAFKEMCKELYVRLGAAAPEGNVGSKI